MSYCPVDHKPCIDDLCYGGGCLKCGESMVDLCPGGCKQLVAVDGTDNEACECEPDDDWDHEDLPEDE